MRAILRQWLAVLLALSLLFASAARAQQATVVISIDYHRDGLINGLAVMSPKGLPATYFVGVTSGTMDLIDNPNYPGIVPTTADLNAAQAAGWEIGIYPNKALVPLLDGTPESEIAMEEFFLTQKSKLAAKGFVAKSIAAPGRAWNATLACLSRGIFHQVRVASDTSQWQTYPIADRYFVKNGATASLGAASTVVGLTADLNNLIASGGVWYVVVHKIGNPSTEPAMIPTPVFSGFIDALAAARDAGQVRVVTFAQSITPPAP